MRPPPAKQASENGENVAKRSCSAPSAPQKETPRGIISHVSSLPRMHNFEVCEGVRTHEIEVFSADRVAVAACVCAEQPRRVVTLPLRRRGIPLRCPVPTGRTPDSQDERRRPLHKIEVLQRPTKSKCYSDRQADRQRRGEWHPGTRWHPGATWHPVSPSSAPARWHGMPRCPEGALGHAVAPWVRRYGGGAMAVHSP